MTNYSYIYSSFFGKNLSSIFRFSTSDCTLPKLLTKELRDDKDIVLNCVKINGFDLQYASKRLKKDNEVILETLKQNERAFKYIDKEIIEKINLKDSIAIFTKLLNHEKLKEKIDTKIDNLTQVASKSQNNLEKLKKANKI